MDVGEIIRGSADRYGAEAAVYLCNRDEREEVSYIQLDKRSNQVKNGLTDLGHGEGDPIGAISWNSIEFIEAYFATQKAGMKFVPINPRLTANEIAYIIDDCGLETLIVHSSVLAETDGLAAELEKTEQPIVINGEDRSFRDYSRFYEYPTEESNVEMRPDAIDGIYYTSGSTGNPKGVLHKQSDRVEVCSSTIAELGMRGQDCTMFPMPLFHSGPLHAGFLPNYQFGIPVILTVRSDLDLICECIETYEATILGAAPAQYNALMNFPNLESYDLSSIRFWWFSGAPMAKSLRERCRDVLSSRYSEIYGTTETGPPISILRPDESEGHLGSCGNGRLNHRVRVVDPDGCPNPEDLVDDNELGEIIVRGPAVMKGYYNLSEATEEVLIDGWYFTGDLARRGEEGYFYIEGRKDNMIVSGGENIYPTEIENVLMKHEKIEDIAVIGIPHERWGMTPKAFVVRMANSEMTADEVISYCKESSELARYKAPTDVAFVDSIPRNPGGGSVIKSELLD